MFGDDSSADGGRFFEFIWDARAGPVLLLNVGGKRLGFAFFCHRRPERSFKIHGYTFPLCSRCAGLVAGFLGVIGTYLLGVQVPFSLGLLMMIPMAVDGVSQFLGLRESSNALRLLTGFMFTLGFVSMLVK